MLVEDNEVNMEVSRSILAREGCQVTAAANGLKALEAFDTGEFDMIFMDCHMPEMDGFEATAAIRERESGTRRHTPIIALTANAIAGDREHCLRAGMDDYISKPVSRQAIQMMLERWHRDTKSAVDDSDDAAGAAARSDVALCDKAVGMLRSLEDSANPGIVRRVMSLFLDATPELLDALREASITRNVETLRVASHTLKSSSASIGALALSERCANLETLAREGRVADAKALVEGIIREFELIRPAIVAQTRDVAEPAEV